MNDELARELEYLRQELTDARADLYAATEENANLLARLQTCQELSGGRLPMSDRTVKIGRLFIKNMSSAIAGGHSGYPLYLGLTVAEAGLLLDALRPFFGDGGA